MPFFVLNVFTLSQLYIVVCVLSGQTNLGGIPNQSKLHCY